MNNINFKLAAARGLSMIQSWVPDGKREGDEWVFINPNRPDQHLGSCKFNLKTGKWADFATGDKGGDAVSLLAYIRGIKQSEAARIILGDEISDNLSVNIDLSSKAAKVIDQNLKSINESLETTSIHYENAKIQDSLPILSAELGIEKTSKKKEKPPATIPIPESKIDELYGFAKTKEKFHGKVTAIYQYRDIDENLIYVRIRYENCPNGKSKVVIPCYYAMYGNSEYGRWVTGEPPIEKLPLYGSENLLKYPEKPVLIVEGEKCKDVCQASTDEYVLITFGGGVSGIHKNDFSILKDRKVILWRDADDPGLKSVMKIKQILPDIEILEIKDKTDGWDVADFITEGGDVDNFIQDCPRIKFEEGIDLITDLPVINVTIEDLSVITPQGWAAINVKNIPYRLFNYGGCGVRLNVDPKGHVAIMKLDIDRLRYETARSAKWVVMKKIGDNFFEILQYPPAVVLRDMLACPDIPLPRLNRVVYAPVFSREGEIETKPGYHEKSQTYYQE